MPSYQLTPEQRRRIDAYWQNNRERIREIAVHYLPRHNVMAMGEEIYRGYIQRFTRLHEIVRELQDLGNQPDGHVRHAARIAELQAAKTLAQEDIALYTYDTGQQMQRIMPQHYRPFMGKLIDMSLTGFELSTGGARYSVPRWALDKRYESRSPDGSGRSPGGSSPPGVDTTPSPPNPNRPLRVWVIKATPGDMSPRLAVARQLGGQNVEVITLEDQRDPIEFIRRRYGITDPRQAAAMLPDVIIGGYSGDGEFIQRVKQLTGGRTRGVNMLVADKSYDLGSVFSMEEMAGYDLIYGYPHQRLQIPPHLQDRVRILDTLPSPVTPESLQHAANQWQSSLGLYARRHPVITVLVGGRIDARHPFLTADEAASLGQQVNRVAGRLGGSLLVTTSMRTTPAATEAFRREITVRPSYIHQFNPDAPAAQNPYQAMLAYSDVIVVTGDSLSMVSDAIATGKPVYIYAPPGTLPPMQQAYVDRLIQLGAARPYEDLERFGPQPTHYPRVNSAAQVAADVRTIALAPPASVPALPGPGRSGSTGGQLVQQGNRIVQSTALPRIDPAPALPNPRTVTTPGAGPVTITGTLDGKPVTMELLPPSREVTVRPNWGGNPGDVIMRPSPLMRALLWAQLGQVIIHSGAIEYAKAHALDGVRQNYRGANREALLQEMQQKVNEIYSLAGQNAMMQDLAPDSLVHLRQLIIDNNIPPEWLSQDVRNMLSWLELAPPEFFIYGGPRIQANALDGMRHELADLTQQVTAFAERLRGTNPNQLSSQERIELTRIANALEDHLYTMRESGLDQLARRIDDADRDWYLWNPRRAERNVATMFRALEDIQNSVQGFTLMASVDTPIVTAGQTTRSGSAPGATQVTYDGDYAIAEYLARLVPLVIAGISDISTTRSA